MALICPTVLTSTPDPHEFREQLERILPFARRIQFDFMDGEFAPTKSIAPIQAWWPEDVTADIHLMFQRPLEQLETLVSLHPHLVIIHAEADGDLLGMMQHLQKLQIKAGIALLKDTAVTSCTPLIAAADHVLLFSGDLGKFGGVADMRVLDKIAEIKAVNPRAEIGWDGGANETNAKKLAEAGVDIINVGGAIQKAANPEKAYATLVEAIK